MEKDESDLQYETEVFKKIYKFEQFWLRLKTYRYFDTPDGEDLVKKIFYTTSRVTPLAIVYGGWESFASGLCPTWQHGVVRTITFTFPITIAAAIYPCTAFLSKKIRNRDDELNHFFAGLSTGIAIYYRNRSPAHAWGYGLFLGVFAALYKNYRSVRPKPKLTDDMFIQSYSQQGLRINGEYVDLRLAYKPIAHIYGSQKSKYQQTPALFYTETPPPLKA